MADDYYGQLPFFVNPLYATERQKKEQADYAAALAKRAGERATRPTGALAAMIDQLTSNIYRNASLQQDQTQYAQALRDITGQNAVTAGGGGPYASTLMEGEPSGPSTASANPPTQNPAVGGNVPRSVSGGPPPYAGANLGPLQPARSVYGLPTTPEKAIASGRNYDGSPRVLSTADMASLPDMGPGVSGASAATSRAPVPAVAGPDMPPTFDQRYAQAFPNSNRYSPAGQARIMMGGGGTIPAEARGIAAGIVTPTQGTDVYGNPTVQSPIGGLQGQRVGPGVAPGINRPISVSPEGATTTTYPSVAPGRGGGGPTSGGGGIVPSGVLQGAIEAGNQLRMNAAGSGAMASFKKTDLEAANAAPALKTVVMTMLDDLQTHGKDWSMGPSAETSLKIKRLAANYAPGFMKDQLESIASAESFQKFSATLAGMTPSSTDAQLLNRIESNPGLHNSFGGAAGLLKMRLQLLDQSQALADATAGATTPEQYRLAKKKFFDDNPLRNPITGNPIKVDIQSSEKTSGGPGYEKTGGMMTTPPDQFEAEWKRRGGRPQQRQQRGQ